MTETTAGIRTMSGPGCIQEAAAPFSSLMTAYPTWELALPLNMMTLRVGVLEVSASALFRDGNIRELQHQTA